MMFKYGSYTVQDLQKEFETSITRGLTGQQVQAKLQLYGLNELTQLKISWISIFLSQMRSIFIYLLLACALISFFLHDRVNTVVILVIVGINALLSFYQEYKAQKTLFLLKQRLAPKAEVIRDGAQITVDAASLVPGDLIVLKAGDIIPADVRFVTAQSIEVDESVLTGESAPVYKTSEPMDHATDLIYKASNLGFMGTSCVIGFAHAIVVAIGSSTVFGQTSELTLQTMRHSNFEKNVATLSKYLFLVISVTISIIFALHLILQGRHAHVVELLLFSIALTLSLMPEALPVVTTFALSQGALHLAKSHVLIKRLSAIEDLGSITMLCTDKTGTLTKNVLTFIDSAGNKNNDPVKYGLLSSSLHENEHDAFDKAIWLKSDASQNTYRKSLEDIQTIPFDPVHKYSGMITREQNIYIKSIKGAPEEVLKLCLNDPDQQQVISNFLKNGNRVIAVACAQNEQLDALIAETHYTLAGFLAFDDPIKEDTKAALEHARDLGIQMRILTGDSKDVACAVGIKIGLIKDVSQVITGAEFEALDTEAKKQVVETIIIFARVTPTQKFEIISLLKDAGWAVGYMGDGVNDAPALKIAHVGLVVEGASDIAKDAADIVLLKKSLFVIVDGVRYGRIISANIMKYIVITLASNFGNLYSLALISFFIDYLPMLPIQILLLNLMSDLPMIAIASDTVDKDDLKKPIYYDVKKILLKAGFFGIIVSIFDWIFFFMFFRHGMKLLRTSWFIEGMLVQMSLIYSLRTKKFFLHAKRPSYLLVCLTILATVACVLLPYSSFGKNVFDFVQPNVHHLWQIILLVIAYIIVNETVKHFYTIYQRRTL